jgi:HSP20 family protein
MYGKFNMAGYGPAFERKTFNHGRRHFGGRYRRPKYNVPINITEEESSYEVTVYATGFDKENIKLSVVEDVLYISGTRSIDENKPPEFIKQEFPVKSFERTAALNYQVNTNGITARQENNILIITLPKTEEAKQPAQEIKVD